MIIGHTNADFILSDLPSLDTSEIDAISHMRERREDQFLHMRSATYFAGYGNEELFRRELAGAMSCSSSPSEWSFFWGAFVQHTHRRSGTWGDHLAHAEVDPDGNDLLLLPSTSGLPWTLVRLKSGRGYVHASRERRTACGNQVTNKWTATWSDDADAPRCPLCGVVVDTLERRAPAVSEPAELIQRAHTPAVARPEAHVAHEHTATVARTAVLRGSDDLYRGRGGDRVARLMAIPYSPAAAAWLREPGEVVEEL